MKRTIISIAIAALAAFSLSAQTTSRESYLDRYQKLVSRLGASGVGVETLLGKWENDYPEDTDMLLGKFSYYLEKSRSSKIEKMDRKRYLGEAPTLTLKDSLDNDVNFFQVEVYDDEVFGKSTQAIDRAIELNPNRLDFRLYKIAALIGYEQESPDMALANLKSIIDFNGQKHPEWEFPGVEMDDETFPALIQDYCYAFYKLGSPNGYEAFKELSEKMLVYYPENPTYMTNIGSYYFVYKEDDKTALKYYNKVLKKHPKEYSTIRNCVLLARKEKNKKLEKKYLPMLIDATTDETEKASAQARLQVL